MPCHSVDGYSEHTPVTVDTVQCVGAAIFRANVNRADLFPAGLLRLPADTETVFATPNEFLSYHFEVGSELVSYYLQHTTPNDLLSLEFKKVGK